MIYAFIWIKLYLIDFNSFCSPNYLQFDKLNCWHNIDYLIIFFTVYCSYSNYLFYIIKYFEILWIFLFYLDILVETTLDLLESIFLVYFILLLLLLLVLFFNHIPLKSRSISFLSLSIFHPIKQHFYPIFFLYNIFFQLYFVSWLLTTKFNYFYY